LRLLPSKKNEKTTYLKSHGYSPGNYAVEEKSFQALRSVPFRDDKKDEDQRTPLAKPLPCPDITPLSEWLILFENRCRGKPSNDDGSTWVRKRKAGT
jgi:hypothetical protein